MKPPEQFRGGRTSGRQWKAGSGGGAQRQVTAADRPTGGGGGARRRQLLPQLRRHTSLATKIAGGGTFGLNIAARGAHVVARRRWRRARFRKMTVTWSR